MTPQEWQNPAFYLIQRDQCIAELKVLCSRAADALEAGWPTDGELERDDTFLIAQLRKAAE